MPGQQVFGQRILFGAGSGEACGACSQAGLIKFYQVSRNGRERIAVAAFCQKAQRNHPEQAVGVADDHAIGNNRFRADGQRADSLAGRRDRTIGVGDLSLCLRVISEAHAGDLRKASLRAQCGNTVFKQLPDLLRGQIEHGERVVELQRRFDGQLRNCTGGAIDFAVAGGRQQLQFVGR